MPVSIKTLEKLTDKMVEASKLEEKRLLELEISMSQKKET